MDNSLSDVRLVKCFPIKAIVVSIMVEVMILSIVVSVIIVEIKSTRSPRHVGNVCLEEELGVCTMLYALAIHWDSSTVH